MKAKHIIGVLLIAVCIAVGAFSLRSSMTPYVSFSEAVETGKLVQVAGALVKDSTRMDRETGEYKFVIRDSEGRTLEVSTKENLPSNFSQSTTVVAIGAYRNTSFEAGRVLVKCPSKYEKKKTGKSHPGELPE